MAPSVATNRGTRRGCANRVSQVHPTEDQCRSLWRAVPRAVFFLIEKQPLLNPGAASSSSPGGPVAISPAMLILGGWPSTQAYLTARGYKK